MQEFDDFQVAVQNVGLTVATAKRTGAALKAAIDAKLEEIGKQVAADTAAPKV